MTKASTHQHIAKYSGMLTVIVSIITLIIMSIILIMTIVLIQNYYKNLRQINLQIITEMSFVANRIMNIDLQKNEKTTLVKALDELSINSGQYRLTDQPLSQYQIHFQRNQLSYADIKDHIFKVFRDQDIVNYCSIYLSTHNKWLNISFPPPILGLIVKGIIFFEAILALIILYFVITALRIAHLWQQLISSAEYYTGSYTANTKNKFLSSAKLLFSSVKNMRRITQRLQELSAQKSFIITALTHNIRTPITRAELLLEIQQDTPEKAKILDELDEINKQVTQISQYTKSTSILDLADNINLYQLIEKIHKKTPNFKIYNMISTNFTIHAQPFAIELAINNLIDNAIKYASQLTITQTHHKKGTKIIFISQIDKDKSHIHYESTGIGIQISDILFKQNGCQLSLEETKDQYIATIQLPPMI
ncbi:hypothetical protein [Cysteiniphilum sp. QT6929]|uniref:sensor histidine kinase n=1 Tax=Cysteiniphilum sp. QT6929 TaxID=2975055 RepID=UPI0024B33A7C|nr:hypothetical protein [Cysteiniphilum sp. QT6929]WHN66385.1 hypothetical protein NYP54_03920 [Cysteiniphilum sp. QT6929]